MCKICTRCKKSYCSSIDENFYARQNSIDGYNTICKKCFLLKKHKVKHVNENGLILCIKCNHYKNNNEFDVNNNCWFREYKDKRCKKCKHEQYQKRKSQNRGKCDLDRMLTERYCALKDRAKAKGLEVNFNKTYLQYLWNKQNGFCAISGIKMTTVFYSGRISTNLSVDRIDSEKGYIEGNVQLVCMAVNQMKNDLTYNELIFICNKIIENEKKNNNN